ncbi:MAG TPA: macro domain-containing protein [Gammaproteobacteria bacterium]|nr:macro domain-containing protein [Gammaproteobacteria bacterium]
MMQLTKGNILEAKAEALVNTVNTKGVMGKGIALQFKKAFPDVFKAYKNACDTGTMQIGKIHIYEQPTSELHHYIINFPTKDDWKKPSKIEYIRKGLKSLTEAVQQYKIRSIAIPALGCGQGGLKWEDVLPLIRSAFESMPEVKVIVYPPQEAPKATKMPNASERPHMTIGRAMVLKLLKQYCVLGYELTLLEIQKLLYFLQESGEPLKLNFEKYHYGPYADNIRHILSRFEGHFTVGFGEGRSNPQTPIQILPHTLDETEKFLAEHTTETEQYNARLERVKKLIIGFESPLGLELLATIHWLVKHEDISPKNPDEIIRKVQSWNQHKKNTMKPAHILVAMERLTQEKWI